MANLKRQDELKKMRAIQEQRRNERRSKRKPPIKKLSDLKETFQDFHFVMSPTATRDSAYRALSSSATLLLYARRFKHEDARRSTTVRGRFVLESVLFAVGKQILSELAPFWQLGKLQSTEVVDGTDVSA